MYYPNSDEKNITHDKRFWETAKTLLSDTNTKGKNKNLSENGEILKTDVELETVKVLNTFFSNVVQNFNISRFPDFDPFIRNIKGPTLKAILKYQKHPSKIASENRYGDGFSFNFVEVNEADIGK